MKIIQVFILIFCVWAFGAGKEFDEVSELSKNFRASNFECQSKKWYCQRECRLQFFETSGSCRQPRADETCFGAPITYNYTWNHAVTRFPQEFELIKRFPSCWSVLGPLLCSTIYRPCSKNEFYVAGNQAPGVLEMWQVFPKSVCETARNACPFVVDAGLWPSFLECEDTVTLKDDEPVPTYEDKEKQKIFSPVSSCKYLGKGTSFPANQCLWPMVAGPDDLNRVSLHRADPVMDSCFMPCETPMTGFEWVLEQFRFRNSLIAGLFDGVFLLITIYLIAFSKIYSSSLSIFCLGQAFLCATIYLAVWVLSGSESFRHVGMCIDNGRIRRSSEMHFFNSCALETLVLTCSVISGYLWIFAIFLLRILRPRIRNNNSFTFGQYGNDHSARIWLAAAVYLTPMVIVGLVAVIFWNELPMDVFSGLCHTAAGSTRHSIVYYGTLVTAMLIVIITGAIVAIQTAIRKHRLHNSLRRRNSLRNRRQHPLLVTIEDGFDRDDYGPQMKHHEAERQQKLSPEMVCAREHGLGEGLINDLWLGLVFASVALSLGIGIFLQYGVLQDSVGSAWERQRVAESVKCSLSSTTPNPPFWWNRTTHHDDTTHEADPFLRKTQLFNSATAPGCDLSPVDNQQLIGLFLATVILPSLPYWILSVCFLTGFCGHGLQSVRKLRRSLNPFIRDEKEVKLDPFLNAEEQLLPSKENIELESIAATVTGTSQNALTVSPGLGRLNRLDEHHSGFPSINTQPDSTFARQPMPLMLPAPTDNAMLVQYIGELKSSQMQQEQRIASLQKLVADGFTKLDEFTEVMAKQNSAPPDLTDSDTSSTTSPVIMPRNKRHLHDKKPKEETIPTGKFVQPVSPEKLIDVTPPEILAARELALELMWRDFFPAQWRQILQPWMLPDPSALTWMFWEFLEDEYDQNLPTDTYEYNDIMDNVLLRLIEHCIAILPNWLSETFRESTMYQFKGLYEADLDIREIMNLVGAFTDSEYFEAPADEKLHTYLMPMAVKAVKLVCKQLHIQKFYLATSTSLYINTDLDINRLKSMLADPEGAKKEAYDAIIDLFKDVPSISTDSDVDMDESDDQQADDEQGLPTSDSDEDMDESDDQQADDEQGLPTSDSDEDMDESDDQQADDEQGLPTSDSDEDMDEPDDQQADDEQDLPTSSLQVEPTSSSSSTDTEVPAKRRKVEDANDDNPEAIVEQAEEVAVPANVAEPIEEPMLGFVPLREMTPMPENLPLDHLVPLTNADVSSLLLDGWTRPPTPQTGEKYLFYMFNFEEPSNPSKVFYEEVSMEYGEKVQRQAVERAMAIFNGENFEDVDDPDPSTFPDIVKAHLDKFEATERGQVAFTLEELYPDVIVRATLTEAEIAVAMKPVFQDVYVHSLIDCHVEALDELENGGPFEWRPMRLNPVHWEMLEQLVNNVPN